MRETDADADEVGANRVEALNALREDLVAAAERGDLLEVGRIERELSTLRANLRPSESNGIGGRLFLSVDERREAAELVSVALQERIPNANFSVVVGPETNCAGSPVVVVTLPSLITDR